MRDTKVKELHKDKDKKRREIELNDLKTVLSTTEGKRFIWRVLDMAGILRNAFAESNGVREWTDFNCGQQNLGLKILQDVLDIHPEAIALMKRAKDSRDKMDEEELKEEYNKPRL